MTVLLYILTFLIRQTFYPNECRISKTHSTVILLTIDAGRLLIYFPFTGLSHTANSPHTDTHAVSAAPSQQQPSETPVEPIDTPGISDPMQHDVIHSTHTNISPSKTEQSPESTVSTFKNYFLNIGNLSNPMYSSL